MEHLDIDYLAQGTTLEEAKRAFERGLKLMIAAHLNRYGHVGYMIRSLTPDQKQELEREATAIGELNHVSAHDLEVTTEEMDVAADNESSQEIRTSLVNDGECPANDVANTTDNPWTRLVYVKPCA